MINSAEEFVALRTSEDAMQSRRAAEESASRAVWLDVIERYPDMRQWVAHNKTIPIEILEALARDADARVRWAVAGKRKLTGKLIELLAEDSDETVRLRLAHNHSVTSDIMRVLALDESWVVRRAAQLELISREGPSSQ